MKDFITICREELRPGDLLKIAVAVPALWALFVALAACFG